MNKIAYILFCLGLFFFSFNSFEGILIFGEFSNEAAFYFFTLGSFFVLLDKNIKIPFYNSIFKALLVFAIWCILCTLLNFNSVSTNYFKYTSGINRFIRQYFVLILCMIVYVIYYYNIFRKVNLQKLFYTIRKIFLLSLLFVFTFGFFETLYGYFGIHFFKNIIDLFNYFPFIERKYFSERIASVGNEPPILAIYLITIFGWMYSYILTEKSKLRKYSPLLMVYFLTFFSGSRTALIIIVIQSLIGLIKIIKKEDFNLFFKKHLPIIISFCIVISILSSGKIYNAISEKIESLNFKDNLTKNISNQSRFGMQYAAIQVWKEHTFVGVGLGQQTYHSRYEYPAWAKKNNYEFRYFYENTAVRAFPPAYNIYTRLLAEVGLIGILILIYIIYLSIRESNKFTRDKSKKIYYLFGLVIYISLIGLYINWFQNDSFKIYGIWISLALLIRIQIEQFNETKN